ncbi:unnamed protein product [Amoebophrya sp. A25]|nr:unnamed protein product [Amoebophrya sp. A25]|eukprot:GSA25T00012173001.1
MSGKQADAATLAELEAAKQQLQKEEQAVIELRAERERLSAAVAAANAGSTEREQQQTAALAAAGAEAKEAQEKLATALAQKQELETALEATRSGAQAAEAASAASAPALPTVEPTQPLPEAPPQPEAALSAEREQEIRNECEAKFKEDKLRIREEFESRLKAKLQSVVEDFEAKQAAKIKEVEDQHKEKEVQGSESVSKALEDQKQQLLKKFQDKWAFERAEFDRSQQQQRDQFAEKLSAVEGQYREQIGALEKNVQDGSKTKADEVLHLQKCHALQTQELEAELQSVRTALAKRDAEAQNLQAERQDGITANAELEKSRVAMEELRKQMGQREKDAADQLREANERAQRATLLQRENEELRKEAAEDGQKYHRVMQGIVEAQEQRVRLETLLEQERQAHRDAVESKGEELQAEFDSQMADLRSSTDKRARELELEKQKLEFEHGNFSKELDRVRGLLDAKTKELRDKTKEFAEGMVGSSSIELANKVGGPAGPSSVGVGMSSVVDHQHHHLGQSPSHLIGGTSAAASASATNIQHTLEVDHLRKKLGEQTKRIEVLVCEKSALNLEIQNMSRRLDLESLGVEFREFAPRKVHHGIIVFDEYCQKGLLYLQKTPNVRVGLFGYLIIALALNVFMCARFLLG